jgi:hypothetical protein
MANLESGRELLAKLFRAFAADHLDHEPPRVFDIAICIFV